MLGHVRWHHRWELHREATVSLGPRFAKLSAAGLASNAADGILFAALPLLATQLTREPVLVALAATLHGLPWLLFELISGEIVDRSDRRRLMVGGNIARAACMVVLAGLVATDGLSLGALYALAFAIGTAETLVDTSWEAIIPRLVRIEDLEVANCRTQAREWTTNDLLGPPIGGFLFGAAAAVPFVINGGAYLVAALLVAALPGAFRTDRADARRPGTIRRDIREGVTWLWHHRVLRTLSILAGVSNLMSTAMMAVFVLFAQEILDLSGAGFGVVLSAIGVGGIIGAAGAHRLERLVGPGTLLIASLAGLAVTALAVALTSSPVVVAAAFLLDGLLVGSWNVVVVSLRQELTPDALRGRVASDARTLAFGAIPLGALLGGALAEVVGLRAVVLVRRIISNAAIAAVRSSGG